MLRSVGRVLLYSFPVLMVLAGSVLHGNAALSAGLGLRSVGSNSMKPSWRTYRNDRAGYAVSYPATWRVSESDAGGVSFSPRRGGGSISVIVRPVTADGPQISDIPDGHCQAIRNANGLAGMRCFNTFSFTWYTVYFGPSATYTISATRQDMGNVYTHLVASFRLIGR